MRISSRLGTFAAVIAAALALTIAAAAASGPARYSSVAEAVDQGVNAYRSGQYEIAIDPLEYAAARRDFYARFYLARIYADNSTVHTNHGRAYMLFHGLAEEFADVDPDDDRRIKFVAEALTAMAGYLRNGLAEIGLKPDPDRAMEYLHHAATFFNDENAQFQLAKLIVESSLQRRGPRDLAREKLAIHWLSVLTTEKRHAGAQALLAYLMWRGEHEPLVRKDPQRAVALITVAAENAPVGERVWIDDYYQEIYCAVAAGQRGKFDTMVQSYRRQYGQPDGQGDISRRDRSALGILQPDAERTCANGEVLPPIRRIRRDGGRDAQGIASTPVREAAQPIARGSMGGIGAPSAIAPSGIIGAGGAAPGR